MIDGRSTDVHKALRWFTVKDYWLWLKLSPFLPSSICTFPPDSLPSCGRQSTRRRHDLHATMAPWSPNPAGLQEILQTIHESTAVNNTAQRNITEVRHRFLSFGVLVSILTANLVAATRNSTSLRAPQSTSPIWRTS